jgi:hypothetical protein
MGTHFQSKTITDMGRIYRKNKLLPWTQRIDQPSISYILKCDKMADGTIKIYRQLNVKKALEDNLTPHELKYEPDKINEIQSKLATFPEKQPINSSSSYLEMFYQQFCPVAKLVKYR